MTLALADAIGGIPADLFDAKLSLGTALVVGLVVLVVATAIAIRRLGAFEISGEVA